MIIPFPQIDPILFEFGPLAVRWYGLAYVAGLLLGWGWCRHLLQKSAPQVTSQIEAEDFDSLLTYVVMGVVVGGRLGHVLFYDFEQSVQNPLSIFALWEGGMSFHGGLIGVVLATVLFRLVKAKPLGCLFDFMACATPIGLFFGRIANFINGELYGRPTSGDWGMIFPHVDTFPRHPSQLYEAFLEGALLFGVMTTAWHFSKLKDAPGRLTGLFGLGYGISRYLVEYVREPDGIIHIWGISLTIGQMLTLPMIAIGIFLLCRRPHSRTH